MLTKIRSALKEYVVEEKIAGKYKFFQAYPGGYGAGDHFLGIDNPSLRTVAREYFRRTELPTLTTLIRSKYHEERLLALILMERKFDHACKQKSSNPELQEQLYRLYLEETKYINNWDLVDLSAPPLLGRYLLEKDTQERDILYRFAASGDLWQERIAILATLTFIRAGEFSHTLKLAAKFLHHEHDLMHKAVGWMLREVGKRDLDTELKFLQEHDYRSIPRTALRYAIEKFPEPLRLQYLKGEA